MTLQEAYKFLRLKDESTSVELDETFRLLIKSYHPDKNLDRAEWSHRMTVALNEAYDLVKNHLQEKDDTLKDDTSEKEQEERVLKHRFDDPLFVQEFREAFRRAKNISFQAVFLYYRYGLENIHLRKEGIFRFKFNSSLKQLQKGIDLFSRLLPHAPSVNLKRYLLLQRMFFEAFLQNMRISKYFIPDGSIDHKAYLHYHNGVLILDAYIKSSFFPEDFPSRNVSVKSLSMSEKEFILVLTDYGKSIWVPEALTKMTLIEVLRRLDKFKTGMTS